MSTLTKVLALLVSALSIFLCGVIVVFITNATNWKEMSDNNQLLAEAAQVQAVVAEESRARQADQYNLLIEKLRESILYLQQQNSELTREIATRGRQQADAVSQAQTAVDLSKNLALSIDIMDKTKDQLQEDLQLVREKMLVAEARVIDLNRSLSSALVNNKNLESKWRQTLREKHSLEEKNAKLNQKLKQTITLVSKSPVEEGDLITSTTVAAGVPIKGKITGVHADTGKVSISVGSADGVRKGARFVVTRGDDKFLGHLDITYVEANEAVGRLINPQGAVVVGDRVVTGFN